MCSICGLSLYRRPSEFSENKKFYCRECQKSIMNKVANIKNKKDYDLYISSWKKGLVSGMRGSYQISRHIINYLFSKYDNKCSRCNWSEVNPYTKKIPLGVEHIDGNYLNNLEENLTLICPNCHSLTKTYKGANRGNGRSERRKYKPD